MSDEAGPDVSRRRVLRAAVPVGAAAVAGCQLGAESDPGSGGPTDAASGSGNAAGADARTPRAGSRRSAEATAVRTFEQSTIASLLDEAAVPLETTVPDEPLAPLRPLRSVIEGATVLGLGEATHGTRDFFRAKHRLLRFAVEELGVRSFAMESNFSAALVVDDYVTGGDLTVDEALAHVSHGVYRRESVRSMLAWLRSYNRGRDPSSAVRFYGVDVQAVAPPARRLRAYFRRVDPDYLSSVAAKLDAVESTSLWEGGDDRRLAKAAELEETAATLRSRLEDRKSEYAAAASRRAWRRAVRHVWCLERAAAYHEREVNGGNFGGYAVRDEAMAANVEWILESEDRDRVAVWGHNAHVSRAPLHHTDVEVMGTHLAESFGDEYYALGLTFGSGSFRAFDPSERSVRTFAVETPSDGTYPAVMSAASHPTFALDFASVADDRLRAWLERPRRNWDVTAVYDPDWPISRRLPELDELERFDGLLFVEETDAAGPRIPTEAATPEGSAATATPE